MLQRLSAVLTAPPKINDDEYLKMRKICASLKTHAGSYEQRMIEARTKATLENIKRIGPYYKPKQWELEYRRQLEGQKFMRQVLYARPKDFVDPYQSPVELASLDDESEIRLPDGSYRGDKYRMLNAQRSYSHIHMVRQMKQSQSQRHTLENGLSHQLSKSMPVLSIMDQNQINKGGTTAAEDEQNDDYYEDEYGDDLDNQADGIAEIVDLQDDDAAMSDAMSEARIHLAKHTRLTKIIDPSFDASHPLELLTTIECFLLENTTALIITAKTVDRLGVEPLIAEAEIDLFELCTLRDEWNFFRIKEKISSSVLDERKNETEVTYNSVDLTVNDGVSAIATDVPEPSATVEDEGGEEYEYDMVALQRLGVDMINSVEVRVEDGVPRLVLNMATDSCNSSVLMANECNDNASIGSGLGPNLTYSASTIVDGVAMPSSPGVGISSSKAALAAALTRKFSTASPNHPNRNTSIAATNLLNQDQAVLFEAIKNTHIIQKQTECFIDLLPIELSNISGNDLIGIDM